MKKFFKIVSCFVFVFAVTCMVNMFALKADEVDLKTQELEEKVKEALGDENGNIDVTKLVTDLEEITKNYSNEEIADIIEKNKEVIEKNTGLKSESIDAGTKMLRTMDTEQIADILKEEEIVEKIAEKTEEGYTPDEILKDIVSSTPTEKKLSILFKFILASKIVRLIIYIYSLLFIFKIVLRWIIYIKAGKHGFAAIIPIYKEIVYFKVCKISPWIIIFVLLPVIGWLILGILKIVSRFELSFNFGKKAGFGVGLWLLPLIFESILAFSKNIKYVDEK